MSLLQETVKEKAERLMRIADAIEESNSRKSSEESLLDDEMQFTIDSYDSSSAAELNAEEKSDIEESKGNNEVTRRSFSTDRFSFSPINVGSDEENTLQTNKTLESVTITPNRKKASENQKQNPQTPIKEASEACKTSDRPRGTINIILSKATTGLESEELDASKSFWSIQKSARTSSQESPVQDKRTVTPSPENKVPRTELLKKNHGIQSALLSVRENARLRYQKLEMEFQHLQENNTALKAEIESLQSQLMTLESSNAILESQLDAVFGKDVAGLLKHTNEKHARLQKELHRVQLERDRMVHEDKELRMKIANCSTCREHIKDDGICKDASVGRRSWWREAVQATSQMFELDKEAEATTTMSVSNQPDQPSAQEVTLTNQPSARPNPLDEDIESLKKRMDDELESLKDEWSTTSSKHSRSNKCSAEKHTENVSLPSLKKKRIEVRRGLGEFLSNTAVSLNDEELDETQSFWSRSARSMSGVELDRANEGEKRKSTSCGGSMAVKRNSLRRTTITTDDEWEHFSSNGRKAAASTQGGRSRLRKMLALPSQAIFDRTRAMGDGLLCLTDQADEQRSFLQRSAQAFISTERSPAHRSAMPPKEEELEELEDLELPSVELIGSRWTSTPEQEDDPLGFIGKEVTAWRGGETTAVNN